MNAGATDVTQVIMAPQMFKGGINATSGNFFFLCVRVGFSMRRKLMARDASGPFFQKCYTLGIRMIGKEKPVGPYGELRQLKLTIINMLLAIICQ